MNLKNRKGFLFVITVFLILTYILLSISIWVKAIEASERAYSELFKESTIELVIDQLTPPKIANVSNIVMLRGMFMLNRHAVEHPVKEGTEYEHQHIEAAMEEYLKTGDVSAEHFVDGIGPDSEYNSSLGGWMAGLNASLSAIGAYIDDFEIYDFSFEQTDINILSYSFRLRISLKDTSGTTSISRTYDINGEIDITGFADPAIARETAERGDAVYRQFFFNREDYSSPGDLSSNRRGSIDAGQGWFYGPLTTVTDASVMTDEHRHRYIVVGDYSDIRSLGEDELEGFGGFIVTSEPGEGSVCTDTTGIDHGPEERDTFNAIIYEGPDCEADIDSDTAIYRPYVVAPGFSMDSAPDCPDLPRGTEPNFKCVLFIANPDPAEVASDPESKFERDGTGIFDVEDMRDFILCGYYVQDPDAPSYLQRLLNDSYSRNSEFGIETFLIGEYMRPSVYDDYDRLDNQLLNGTLKDYFVRGMPGCRDFEMCDNEGTITGRFGLSTDTIDEYGVDDIDCGEGARCES